jgi:hypothetical protein
MVRLRYGTVKTRSIRLKETIVTIVTFVTIVEGKISFGKM